MSRQRPGRSGEVAGAPGSTGAGPAPAGRPGFATSGPGSVARFPVRLLAFAIDAIVCDLIALLFGSIWWNIVVLAVEMFLLTAVGGQTLGMRLARLQVVRLDGRPVGFGWSAVRTALLLLVVPAFMVDRDGRGMHDRAAGTALINLGADAGPIGRSNGARSTQPAARDTQVARERSLGDGGTGVAQR